MPDPSAAPTSSPSQPGSPVPLVSPVRIILVDDDPLTRAAIKPLLRPREDYRVVAEAGDGRQAIDVVGRVEADIVLMDDDPRKLSLAMRISRKTMRLVWQNIVFALAVKAVCLVLGALGIANMWVAIFADVGVMVLCVLNAARALDTKRL